MTVFRSLQRVLGLAFLLAAPGCKWRRVNEVVLGEVAARTGDRALWGEDLHRGIELAVEQQNARGGINGRRIRLVTLDDESRDERAATLTTRLIDKESPFAVFGELSSTACERSAAAAQRRNMLYVSPASAARDISRVGEFVFRTSITDAEQASAIARHARVVLQKRRAAIAYRRSALLDVGMADTFARAFRAGGGEVALRDSYTDDAELVRLVGRVRAANVDVIYAPAGAIDAGRIAVAMRQGRVTAQLLGSDGWSSTEVRRYAQDAVVGALFTDGFSANAPRPEVDAFVNAFRARYRALPGTFAAEGYDAVQWLLRAAVRAPQIDPVAIRDLLLGSRLDEAVAGPFTVDSHRVLNRAVPVLRYERDGVAVVGSVAQTP